MCRAKSQHWLSVSFRSPCPEKRTPTPEGLTVNYLVGLAAQKVALGSAQDRHYQKRPHVIQNTLCTLRCRCFYRAEAAIRYWNMQTYVRSQNALVPSKRRSFHGKICLLIKEVN